MVILRFAEEAAALETMNAWVNSVTAGRIPNAIDEVSKDAQIFLGRSSFKLNYGRRVNALLPVPG